MDKWYQLKRSYKRFFQIKYLWSKTKGEKVAILGLGTFYQLGEKLQKLLWRKTGVKGNSYKLYIYQAGVGWKIIRRIERFIVVITLEDGILNGGFKKIIGFLWN